MRFKKLAAVCTTAVLTAAMAVGGVSLAQAEEAPTPEATTSVVEEAAPVVEPAPIQEEVAVEPAPIPEPAPVVEEEPAPVVEEEPVTTEPLVTRTLSPPEALVQATPVVIGTVGTIIPSSSDSNKADWWTNYGEHDGAQCYKAGGNTAHGSITDNGLTVTLNEFQDSWPGDHWEMLAIKAANSVNVIQHPEAGVAYASPLTSNGKNQATVSHWIVCKGETPPPVCPAYDFPNEKMWEVTWGWDFENRNGNAPKFTMTSHGGMTGINGGAIPQYMLDYKTGVEWQWLYVTTDRTVTYEFADGTVWTAVVTNTGCTPSIVWTMTPPVTYLPTCDTVTGYQTIVGDGVLSVEGDWATDHIDVPFTGTLADIGTVLDIDAEPIGFVGLHIDTDEGTIVFEEEPSYNGKLWSQSAWAGVSAGMGYAAFGTIGEYIHRNGDVAVTGIRLLYTHPDASSTTVTSFTIGCTVYTFEIPDQPEDKVVPGVWVDGEYDCDDTTVEQTREVSTTTYVLNDEFVWVEGETTVTTETQTRDLTDEEIEALDCPVPTVPERPVPPTKVTVDELQYTGGGDMSGLGFTAFLLLLLGTATVGGLKLIRGRN